MSVTIIISRVETGALHKAPSNQAIFVREGVQLPRMCAVSPLALWAIPSTQTPIRWSLSFLSQSASLMASVCKIFRWLDRDLILSHFSSSPLSICQSLNTLQTMRTISLIFTLACNPLKPLKETTKPSKSKFSVFLRSKASMIFPFSQLLSKSFSYRRKKFSAKVRKTNNRWKGPFRYSRGLNPSNYSGSLIVAYCCLGVCVMLVLSVGNLGVPLCGASLTTSSLFSSFPWWVSTSQPMSTTCSNFSISFTVSYLFWFGSTTVQSSVFFLAFSSVPIINILPWVATTLSESCMMLVFSFACGFSFWLLLFLAVCVGAALHEEHAPTVVPIPVSSSGSMGISCEPFFKLTCNSYWWGVSISMV